MKMVVAGYGPEELIGGKELIDLIIAKLREAPDAYKQQVLGEPSEQAPCGSAGCLLGWGMVFSGMLADAAKLAYWRAYTTQPMWNTMNQLLGLDEEKNQDRLFTAGPTAGGHRGWPEPFASDWAAADSNEARAAVGIAILTKLRNEGPEFLSAVYCDGYDYYNDSEDDDIDAD